MEQTWIVATVWITLALAASLISVRIGVSVALVEEGGSRPSVEPSAPEDAYFFLSRPRAGRYFIWRLFRSKADATEFLRKHKLADAHLERWIATATVETFEDLVRPDPRA